MAGIVFPDIAGTLAPILQLESADRRNALEESRQKKLDAEEERLNSAKQYVPGALAGDQDAFSKLAAIHPDMAIKIRGVADQKDAARLARMKAGAEWLGGAAGGVLSAPPEEKAAAYQQYLADGKARGIDMSTMPQQYSPAVDSTLRYHLNSAVGASKVFEHLESQPQAMPYSGGGAAPAPGPAPDLTAKGQPVASRLTGTYGFSPVAAAGVTGGLAQESSFNPGYGFTQPGGDNGSAVGIGQWRNERAQGLVKFAQAQGKPPTDINTQVDYLVNEMKSGDMGAQRAYAMLQTAKTPEEATTAMMHFFRPAGYTPDNPQAGHGYAQRVQYSQQFMPPGGPQPTMGTTPPSLQAAGANAVAGTPPASLVAQGANAVPMPQPPQFAQAAPPTGAPPGMPVGGDAPMGQPGTMPAPPAATDPAAAMADHVEKIRAEQRARGVDVFKNPKTNQPEEQNGMLVLRSIANPRQVIGYAPLPPKAKEPSAAGTDSGDVAILQSAFANPSIVQTPEWKAAYARQAQPKQAQGGQLMYPNMGVYDQFLNGAKPPQTDARIEDTPQSRFQMSGKLADDFNQLKPVKAYREVVPIMESMKDALTRPTPVSDLNLVYGLAKIMDPESVVREGEQVMVRNAQSLPDWLRGMISKAQGGSGFVPEQRARIIQEAESRVGALKGQFDAIAGQFGDRAKRYGLNPDDVLTVPSNQPPEAEKKAQATVYLAPGDRPVNRNEIEETARNRNMTPEQVIKLLNLKPSK